MSPELLSAAVTMGETLVGLNLSKGQFSRIFLGGGVFSKVDFSEADFRGADLRETVFDQCNLQGALFGGRAAASRCFQPVPDGPRRFPISQSPCGGAD